MRDLQERLREVERISPPDLWDEVRTRHPRHPEAPPHRVATAGLALLISTAAIAFAAWGFLGGRDASRPASPRPTGFANGAIAFVRAGPGWMTVGHDTQELVNPEIYTVNADGNGLRNLTRSRELVGHPAWSPDGGSIAFQRAAVPPSGAPLGRIYVMDADGRNLRMLTDCRRADCVEGDSSPAWSPDGSKIAFTRSTHSGVGIYVMGADGTGLTRISEDRAPIPFGTIAWSPDGKKIAFDAYERSDPPEIYVMNADGSGVKPITSCDPAECVGGNSAPSWSPDGRHIVFIRGWAAHGDVHVIRSDGTRPLRLTHCRSPHCRGRDSSPVWSPDGTKIAFVRGVNYGGDVYVMNADGTGIRRVTSGRAFDCCLSWQPLPVASSPSPVSSPCVPRDRQCLEARAKRWRVLMRQTANTEVARGAYPTPWVLRAMPDTEGIFPGDGPVFILRGYGGGILTPPAKDEFFEAMRLLPDTRWREVLIVGGLSKEVARIVAINDDGRTVQGRVVQLPPSMQPSPYTAFVVGISSSHPIDGEIVALDRKGNVLQRDSIRGPR